MRFGKTKMFLYFNGLVAAVLLLYFLPWFFSTTTTGKVVTPFEANAVHAQYRVDQELYTGSYMRNGIQFSQQTVSIRYLRFDPSVSRVNSFMGMLAEPLAWWGVLLVASGMLLFTNNGVFAKGTIFQLHRRFPWISMEEYFPVEAYMEEEPFHRSHHEGAPRKKINRLPGGDRSSNGE